MIRLEHVNLNVRNLEASLRFFRHAFPTARVRGGGVSHSGETSTRWVHFGDEHSYLAIQQAVPAPVDATAEPFGELGVNHAGFTVKDAKSLAKRLSDAGYEQTYDLDQHPGRHRVYFLDDDGFEWEFVEYRSSDDRVRNDYSDAPGADELVLNEG